MSLARQGRRPDYHEGVAEHVRAFEVLLCGGFVLTLLGAWLATRERIGPRRWWVALPALVALPVGTGIEYRLIAASQEPMSLFIGWRGFGYGSLPEASEGRFDPRRPARLVVTYGADGRLRVEGEACTLAQMERQLRERNELPALLSMDQHTPFLHFAWILDAVAASGRQSVLLSVSLRRRGTGYWPDGEIELPLGPGEGGRALALVARAEVDRHWGPCEARKMVLMPSEIVYLDGDLKTEEIGALGEGIREGRFTSLRAIAKMPLKYVIGVLNEALRCKVPMPRISNWHPSENADRPPPSEEVRQAPCLPYPEPWE